MTTWLIALAVVGVVWWMTGAHLAVIFRCTHCGEVVTLMQLLREKCPKCDAEKP